MTATLCVDLVLVVLAGEAGVLVLLHRFGGRGPAPSSVAPNLLAGFMLVLALRCGLADAGLPAVAACLGGALVAHAADLRARWRG